MSVLPADFDVAWDRLARLGWRLEQIELIARPTQGERNRVYTLRHAGVNVVVRLPRERVKPPEWYEREMHNLAAAAAAGVTPAPLLADPVDGLLVLPRLRGEHPTPGTISPQTAARIGHCLRKLHRETTPFSSETDTLRRVRHNVIRVAAEAAEARRHAAGLPTVARAMEPVIATLERTAPPPVSCHGDLVLGNIIDDGTRVFLIDWETSAAGDPHQDIGNVCLRARLEGAARAALLDACFLGDPALEARRAQARVALWEPLCALDKALTYWRNGMRYGFIDSRVKGWTQRCSNLLTAPGMRVAVLFLDTLDRQNK